MKKLLAAIFAGVFAVAMTSPVIAQDKKKDGAKKEMKKGEGKKAEGKKAEGKKKSAEKKK